MKKQGCCGNCAGCAGILELTAGEMEMLQKLAQYAFLPVARREEDGTPVYLEGDRPAAVYSLILRALEQKRLISLDYDKPLSGFEDPRYAAYAAVGSMALTARGQSVVETLEMQGIAPDA